MEVKFACFIKGWLDIHTSSPRAKIKGDFYWTLVSRFIQVSFTKIDWRKKIPREFVPLCSAENNGFHCLLNWNWNKASWMIRKLDTIKLQFEEFPNSNDWLQARRTKPLLHKKRCWTATWLHSVWKTLKKLSFKKLCSPMVAYLCDIFRIEVDIDIDTLCARKTFTPG